jgi:hypothetical protein
MRESTESAPGSHWPETHGRETGALAAHIRWIAARLKNKDEELATAHVWDAVAALHAPEWLLAQARVHDSAARLARLDTPLGPVGMALEGEEVNAAEDDYIGALALFTIIDEELRADPALRDTEQALHGHWKAITTAVDMARAAALLGRKAPPRRIALSGTFGRFAAGIWGKAPAARERVGR